MKGLALAIAGCLALAACGEKTMSGPEIVAAINECYAAGGVPTPIYNQDRPGRVFRMDCPKRDAKEAVPGSMPSPASIVGESQIERLRAFCENRPPKDCAYLFDPHSDAWTPEDVELVKQLRSAAGEREKPTGR
ncbi:hypothetical protein FDR95_24395 [Rhizobiaceae bacterium LC148]|nr:hypothetical protein FDR95_24395 [Rhizobiaceae bacterium LC148]